MKSIKSLKLYALLPAIATLGLVAGLVTLDTPSASAAGTVSMDRIVVQSQVEPVVGQTRLPGDDSVKKVQQALDAKGYHTKVDGYFGTGTRSDYSAWQRHLGHAGNAANGIPGVSSLTKLGTGRWTVQRKINVGHRRSYSGVTVNERTLAMVKEADRHLSWSIDLTKGSYVGCDSDSSCTHAYGGAVDISVNWEGSSYKLTKKEQTRAWQMVRMLRKVGFAAWLRTPSQANWPYHIHAIAVGDTDMHRQAANQVADYYRGRNGLSRHEKDNTPKQYRVPFTWFEAYKRGNQ
jgi:peptidoglycan hydrolase-like protein with peptidoglycan-binding domain